MRSNGGISTGSSSSSSSLLLSSVELSDTKAYGPEIRALFGTASHFCQIIVLKLRTVPKDVGAWLRIQTLREGSRVCSQWHPCHTAGCRGEISNNLSGISLPYRKMAWSGVGLSDQFFKILENNSLFGKSPFKRSGNYFLAIRNHFGRCSFTLASETLPAYRGNLPA